MDTNDKNDVQKQTKASKQEAINQARKNNDREPAKGHAVHIINPLTGTESNIKQEDIESM